MSFVLEKVSEADIKKYGLRAINNREFAADADYEWVRDAQRDVYLRYIKPGDREEQPLRKMFHLYWKGHLITIWLVRKVEGERYGKGSTTWEFWGWTPPAELHAELGAMVEAMKAALTVYRDAGTYSFITENTAIFKNF